MPILKSNFIKKYFYFPLVVLLLATFVQTELSATNSYEMQRMCKDRAVRTYLLKREKIYTAVPRLLYGKYSVYSKSPKNREDALFFVCNFNRNGRFLNIKTEKDLRRNTNRPVKLTKAAKRSCRGEASSVWRVSQRDVDISNIRRVNSGRYKMTVKARNRTAICDVNVQGNIYSFRVQKHKSSSTHTARKSCKRAAARYWDVPQSRVVIERTRKIHSGRYNMYVRYGYVEGKCDVSHNGHIYHFRTKHRY